MEWLSSVVGQRSARMSAAAKQIAPCACRNATPASGKVREPSHHARARVGGVSFVCHRWPCFARQLAPAPSTTKCVACLPSTSAHVCCAH